MINGSPTLNNFPVQILIQEFEKMDKSDDIEKIVEEFLDYIGKTVPKTNMKNFLNQKINEYSMIYGNLAKENYQRFIDLCSGFDIEIPKFINNEFDYKFKKLIKSTHSQDLKEKMIQAHKKAFCQYLITESTGIVITGISKNHHFPSCISFNMILNNNGIIEIMNKNCIINCNETKLELFGQNDVIESYLTGIDENFESKLLYLIETIFQPDAYKMDKLKSEIENIKRINKRNMLSKLDTMPENDLCSMIETLIKSTEIKRKLNSDVDNVGGPINIEKISKSGIDKKI